MSYSNDIIEKAKMTKQLIISPFAQSFRWCNNDCDFCYLKNYMSNIPPTIESIKNISNNVILWLNDNIDKIPEDVSFKLIFIGGEMFCLDNNYYKEYKFLIDEVTKVACSHNHKINYLFFSNLLYNTDKLNNLVTLAKEYGATINTSFDVVGRFKSKDILNMWYNNINILKENSIETIIGMIISHDSIQKILNDNNDYFVKMFYKLIEERWNIGYDLFISNNGDEYNIPSPDEIIDFYKHIIDKFSNILSDNPIFNYEEVTDSSNYYRDMDCTKISFLSDSEDNPELLKIKGEYNIAELYCNDICIFNMKQNILKINDNKCFICNKYRKQMDYYYNNILKCITCKYNNYCKKYDLRDCCIVKSYKTPTDKCWVKEVLKYIKNKHEQNI